ncbi:hypothetical protein AYO41_05110 [Verrucomicrobia bacterium SCGC AG-212-E04]|nr:hypothetical protein AYO41_05110 [Verrucomicrobia bacterium SCGC AG-212-E04]
MRDWVPARRARVVVIAVHGLSGASLDFKPLGMHLARRGTAVYAFELRGQGLDPQVDRRGNLANLDDCVRDLGAFTTLVRARHPRTKFVYYGESMGAMLCLYAVAAPGRPAVDGLILASPVIDFERSINWWQTALLRTGLILTPQHRLDFAELGKSQAPEAHITRDRAYEASLETAPHALSKYSLRFIDTLFRHIRGSRDAARAVTVPTLVLYAGHDVFIKPPQVERIVATMPARDKTLRFFPTSYHLLLHDYDRDKVLREIDRWLSRLLR